MSPSRSGNDPLALDSTFGGDGLQKLHTAETIRMPAHYTVSVGLLEAVVPLTSVRLVVLVVLMCLAFGIALVLPPDRSRGELFRRWMSRALGRVAATVGMSLSVLVLAGLFLNNIFYFYVNWQDLLGSRTVEVTTHAGASLRVAEAPTPRGGGLTALVKPPATLPPLPNPGARLQRYTIHGPASGLVGQIWVSLPRDYAQGVAAGRRYPVIMALHGFPGSPRNWEDAMGLPDVLDRSVLDHRVGEAIIVMPQNNLPLSLDTECVNGQPGTPQMETWLARDVPQFAVTHFRVKTTRSAWAVMGLSEGGFCSAMLGLRHSDIFGASVVFSGYFHPDFPPGYAPLGSQAVGNAYNLIWIAGHRPPPLAMWVTTSNDDRLSFGDTVRFIKAAKRPLSVTAIVQRNVGHRFSVWMALQPRALAWLGDNMKGFAPHG